MDKGILAVYCDVSLKKKKKIYKEQIKKKKVGESHCRILKII